GLALLNAATDAFVAAPREAKAPTLRGSSRSQAQAQSPGVSSLSALAAGGAVAAAVATGRPGRQTRSSLLPTSVKENRVACKALDQSSRYADLSLDEATLV
ncbi:rbcL, partial [Symbiodinium pilosum]